jgi:DNA-binding LytR/AlgR family response regulator
VTEPIRAVIVDDEKLARDRLRGFLDDADGVEVLGEAADGCSGVSLIDAERPDLAFLDVQMPGLDGFGVLARSEHHPHVVFATAHDDYAIRAFEVHALDYLLKPISRRRLAETLRRVRARLETQPPDWQKLLAAMKGEQRRYDAQLPVHKGKRILVLPTEEVFWFEVEYRLVHAHTESDRYMTSFTLKDLEERLDPDVFFRAHKSRIVNLRHVQAIVPWFGGRFKLVMKNQEKSEVELSRAQARVLRRRMQW